MFADKLIITTDIANEFERGFQQIYDLNRYNKDTIIYQRYVFDQLSKVYNSIIEVNENCVNKLSDRSQSTVYI